MNLVGYVRVSTLTQEDNTSLASQREAIRVYCNAHGHRLVEIYQDIGSGGAVDHRENYLETLEKIREKSVDGLIAAKLDRIARNTSDVLYLVEEILTPSRKALVVLDLGLDTSTPVGKLLLTVMAAVAALERDLIKERTSAGRKAKYNNGGYAYGAPPFGFKAEDGELIENGSEKETIEKIKEYRRHGFTLERIAKALQVQGRKTKRGGKWQKETVRKILNREGYR